MFVSSCECVPDINTSKIISPDDYSLAMMVNAIPDRENLKIESNDVPLLKSIAYSDAEYAYQKIQGGDSYLRLIDAQINTSLFNMPISLKKFEHYTIIFYGYRNSAKAIILSDSSSSDKGSLRFVHASFDAGEYVFRLKGGVENIEQSLSFLGFTELKNLSDGAYQIEVFSPDLEKIIFTNNLLIENGKIYSVILKGTFSVLPNKPLVVDIVTASKE